MMMVGGDQIWEKQMSDELSGRAPGFADSRTLLSVLTLGVGLPLDQGSEKVLNPNFRLDVQNSNPVTMTALPVLPSD